MEGNLKSWCKKSFGKVFSTLKGDSEEREGYHKLL